MKQGELLKIRLKKKGLSLDVVAKKLGISRATLYNLFEKEELTDAYLDKFKKLGIKLPEADEEDELSVPPVKAPKRDLSESTERMRIAISDLKNNRGVSLQAMADKTAMPHQNIFNVKQGNNNATEAMVNALCDAYGIRKEYIYLGQAPMYEGQHGGKGGLTQGFAEPSSARSVVKKIPMYENVDALGGKIDIFVDNNSAYVTGYADIPNLGDSDAIIKISGDSMYPRYKAGDLIAIKRIHDYSVIEFGQPHVIVTAEQRLVKYLRRAVSKTNWLLCSENKAHYDDFEIEVSKVKHLFLIRGLVRFENL